MKKKFTSNIRFVEETKNLLLIIILLLLKKYINIYTHYK